MLVRYEYFAVSISFINLLGTASAKKAAEAASKGSPSKATVGGAPPAVGSVKRKQHEKALALQNGDVDGVSVDGEGSIDDDGHELPPRLNKKRRISLNAKVPSRSELQKAVIEMGTSVNRIQASVAKEVNKMNSVINSLKAVIADMESD